MNGVVVVSQTQINLDVLSKVAETCLDRNPLRDSAGTRGTLQHVTSVFDTFRGGNVSDMLTHVGVLIGLDERDFTEVAEVLSLPHVIRETTQRGVLLAIFVGSLQEWKGAFDRAKTLKLAPITKDVLNRIACELQVERQYLLT